MAGRRWTKAEDRTAREMAADGASREEAARHLGRTWTAVRDRQNYLGRGFGFRRGPEPDLFLRSRILTLVSTGADTAAAVARLMGDRTTSAVRKLIRSMVREGLIERRGGKLVPPADWVVREGKG